jgi:hypothetical protein
MSQQTQTMKAERHARLFELIRQRNLANQVKAQAAPVNLAEAQLFRLQAERSISPGITQKLAS